MPAPHAGPGVAGRPRGGGSLESSPAGPSLSAEEHDLLARAILLGRRGWGRVHPNPMVGCVIARDGRTLGEGWHEEFGGPHAEVRALEHAGSGARGATAFVSLEPCRHQGKTSACTLALQSAGVSRLVFAVADPGVESGGGAAVLRAGGMDVIGPVQGDREAFRENAAFFHEAWTGRAYLALKLALTLDGKIARRAGERTLVSGPEAQREVQRLRAGHDAVMVGANTARVDDPLLTVREVVPMRKPPARILLDPGATVPTTAAVFRDVGTAPLVVFVREDAPESALERIEGAGASVHPVPAGAAGLDLGHVLEVCHATGLRSILCEGGSRLASSLLAEGRASRLYLFLAPRTLGEGGVPAFAGALSPSDWDGWEPALAPAVLGRDVLLTYDRLPSRPSSPPSPAR